MRACYLIKYIILDIVCRKPHILLYIYICMRSLWEWTPSFVYFISYHLISFYSSFFILHSLVLNAVLCMCNVHSVSIAFIHLSHLTPVQCSSFLFLLTRHLCLSLFVSVYWIAHSRIRTMIRWKLFHVAIIQVENMK